MGVVAALGIWPWGPGVAGADEIVVPDAKTHHHTERPWTGLRVADADRFHFAVVSDNSGGERRGVFAGAVQRLNLLQPAFVLSVGDFIGGYTRSRVELAPQWDRFEKLIGQLRMPFFYVAGNHDYSNATMAEIWKERFGRSYYHFLYRDTLFIIINSELFDLTKAPWWTDRQPYPYDRQQKAQMMYVKNVLRAHPEVRWTFVFLHQPFWRRPWAKPKADTPSPANGPWPTHDFVPPDWERVEELLENRNYTIFAGHQHTYDYRSDQGPHVHEKIALATTGGGSRLRGVEHGEFDHIVWVTMTDGGPVIANLKLDGILDKALPTPKQRPRWAE